MNPNAERTGSPSILYRTDVSHVSPPIQLAGLSLLFGLFLLFSSPSSLQGQITIQRSVLGNGATIATNGATTVAATFGQSVAGPAQLNSLGVYQGFWGFAQISLSVPVTILPVRSEQMQLFCAGPNPFSSSTTVGLILPSTLSRTDLRVTLHNGLGTEVARLYDGGYIGGEPLMLPVDGTLLSSGVYFVRLQSTEGVHSLTITLQQ